VWAKVPFGIEYSLQQVFFWTTNDCFKIMIDVTSMSDTSERIFSLQRPAPGKENESIFNEEWPICRGLTVTSVISTVELHLSWMNWDGESSGYAENPDN
jgi:hypothetical protein